MVLNSQLSNTLYLDGKIVSFGSVQKQYAEETKQEVYDALFPSIAKATTQVSNLADFHNYCEGQD